MRKFEIPEFYKSPIISEIKRIRKEADLRKKDYSPTRLDFGPVEFIVARHFGFCFGVENAIEIAYKTIDENPGKRIFLLSEMIHNPGVNDDLLSRGVKFIMDTAGRQMISWEEINKDDIVLIPAFGTTLEIEKKLRDIGLEVYKYNTTCPFVEKVWKRADSLGSSDHTIIIHGKHTHEETRATFSHSSAKGKSVIVRDIDEAKKLCSVILGENDHKLFFELFEEKFSEGFNPAFDLDKVGVVNQTTMLASETEEIAELVRNTMVKKFGKSEIKNHFADTRDTLCYATNDNQQATIELLNEEADFAIVVGGYNSSNTSHIVELLQEKFDTFFISGADEIINKEEIYSFDLGQKKRIKYKFLVHNGNKLKLIITSGASCPDSEVEKVIHKILFYYDGSISVDSVINKLEGNTNYK